MFGRDNISQTNFVNGLGNSSHFKTAPCSSTLSIIGIRFIAQFMTGHELFNAACSLCSHRLDTLSFALDSKARSVKLYGAVGAKQSRGSSNPQEFRIPRRTIFSFYFSIGSLLFVVFILYWLFKRKTKFMECMKKSLNAAIF